ncbi:MAG: ABC transporter permease [Actinomycetota bacterium]|nr:ABC transporter permease [Actinomycetota bacterium]
MFPVEIEDQAISGVIATLPAAAVAQVAAIPGVAAAHGEVMAQNLTVVDRTNTAIGPTSGAPTLGYNWYPRAHPIAELVAGHAPTGPAQVVLDQPSAAARSVALGDPVRIVTPSGTLDAQVVGLARSSTPNPGVGLVLLDTPTAQTSLLGQPGTVTAVTADVAPGDTDTAVAARIRAALGAGVSVQTKHGLARSASNSCSNMRPTRSSLSTSTWLGLKPSRPGA